MADQTLSPGDNIQTLGIDVIAATGDTIFLNDGFYGNQSLDTTGKTFTIRPTSAGTRWYGLDQVNYVMISGGSVAIDTWTAGGGGWWSDISSFSITQLQTASSKNENIRARDRDRMVVTVDEKWAQQVDSIGNLGDALRTGSDFNMFVDYSANRLYLDHDPTGTKVIIGRQTKVISGTGNLTIQDLTIAHSREDWQQPGVLAEGDNSTFTRVELWAHHMAAFKFKADNVTLQLSHIHHSGQLGFGSDLTGSTNDTDRNNGVHNVNNASVLDVKVEYSNMNFYVAGDEAAHAKMAWTDNFRGHNITAQFSYGFGLWMDINNYNFELFYNDVQDIWAAGIINEIGFAGKIKWNKIQRAGTWPTRTISSTFPDQAPLGFGFDTTPGISWAESNPLYDRSLSKGGGVGFRGEIRHNIVNDNRGGIYFRQIDRDNLDQDGGRPTNAGDDAYHVKGVDNDHNDVWWDDTSGGWPGGPAPKHGGGQNTPWFPKFNTLTGNEKIEWEDNDYTVNGTRTIPSNGRFDWNKLHTYSSWQNTLGHDDVGNAGADASPQGYGITGAHPLNLVSGDATVVTTAIDTGPVSIPVPTVSTGTPPAGADGYMHFQQNLAVFIRSLDSAQLSVTGDIELRALMAPADWTPVGTAHAIIGKIGGSTDRAYRFLLDNFGANNLRMDISDTGTDNFVVWQPDPGFLNDAKRWVRLIARPSVGTGEVFWADDSGGPGTIPSSWTSLGTVTFAAFATIFDSTGQVELGRSGFADNAYNGKLFAAEIWNGVEGEGGSRIANPDFRNTAQQVNATTWTDSHSNQWDVIGSLTYVPPTGGTQTVAPVSTIDATLTVPTPTVATFPPPIPTTTITGALSIPAPTILTTTQAGAAGFSGGFSIGFGPLSPFPPIPTVNVSAQVPVPVVALSHTSTPATITVPNDVPAPTAVTADALMTPATVDAPASVPGPLVDIDGTVASNPSVVPAPASLAAPTVTADALVTPVTVAAPASVAAPVVQTGFGGPDPIADRSEGIQYGYFARVIRDGVPNLVLIPIGRSQSIGVKSVEGFESVSDVFAYITGTEDQIMLEMAAAWAANKSAAAATLEVELEAVLTGLGFREPSGTTLP